MFTFAIRTPALHAHVFQFSTPRSGRQMGNGRKDRPVSCNMGSVAAEERTIARCLESVIIYYQESELVASRFGLFHVLSACLPSLAIRDFMNPYSNCMSKFARKACA